MDDGRWTMDDGRWTMDDGRWTMDDGRWTMDDGQEFEFQSTNLVSKRAKRRWLVFTSARLAFSFICVHLFLCSTV
jgi:hypothetical protein